MSSHVIELEANDSAQVVLTRALAHRAAGNAWRLLNEFQLALNSYNSATALLETIDEPVELGGTLHAKVGPELWFSHHR